MREAFIIFIVLLVLLMVISVFGGSIRFTPSPSQGGSYAPSQGGIYAPQPMGYGGAGPARFEPYADYSSPSMPGMPDPAKKMKKMDEDAKPEDAQPEMQEATQMPGAEGGTIEAFSGGAFASF